MALDPPHPNPVGRKSHLHKAQEKATTKIKKEKKLRLLGTSEQGVHLKSPSIDDDTLI
jgi:hypothetical protein